MKESYRKGIAIRPGPESCMPSREASIEAMTGHMQTEQKKAASLNLSQTARRFFYSVQHTDFSSGGNKLHGCTSLS